MPLWNRRSIFERIVGRSEEVLGRKYAVRRRRRGRCCVMANPRESPDLAHRPDNPRLTPHCLAISQNRSTLRYSLVMSARASKALVPDTDNAASGIESDSNSNDGVDRAAEEG